MKFVVPLMLVMTEPFRPGVLDTLEPFPRHTPAPRPATLESLKRVPWSIQGGQFLINTAKEICQPHNSLTSCQTVKPQSLEHGYRVYEKATGRFLFIMDRAIAEEVQQDYAAARNTAEEHFPWSNYIAKLESQKSNLEYIAISCNSGFGPYCGGMAAKLGKFQALVLAGCSVALGSCQKLIKDKQTEIQKEIDKVLAVCQKGDEACFDYITGGKETEARLERQQEIYQGSRPPHTPSRLGYRPMFTPASGADGDPMKWWDKSCDSCNIYDGAEAEDY